MILGAHTVIYGLQSRGRSRFLPRRLFQLSNVGEGEGWHVFGLLPSEVVLRPSGKNNLRELYLMRDDVAGFIVRWRNAGSLAIPHRIRHADCRPTCDYCREWERWARLWRPERARQPGLARQLLCQIHSQRSGSMAGAFVFIPFGLWGCSQSKPFVFGLWRNN